MSNTSRNHHYIPQFYLKGFLDPSDPKKQLYVIDKAEKRGFPSNPRDVGSKHDFNRVEIPGLPIDDAETRLFAPIDSEADQALKYIADNETLPKDEKMDILIYFVSVLAAHNPHIRNTMIDTETEIREQQLGWLVSSREVYESQLEQVNLTSKELSYEEAKQFVEEGITIKYPHGYHLGHELETIQNTIFPLFSSMQWSLLIAEVGTSNFVCSDRPVVLHNIEPAYLRYFDIPAQTPTVGIFELTVPLNRRMALHATFRDPAVIAMVGKEDVAAVNGLMIHAATKQIYCANLEFKFLENGEIKSGRNLVN